MLQSSADAIVQANILIKKDHRACLIDFGLSTTAQAGPHAPGDTSKVSIHSTTSLMPYMSGGTYRWMSPELLDPGMFGLDNGRPTKQSDCYALGMVIYEVGASQLIAVELLE